jgi:hypothetical protein
MESMVSLRLPESLQQGVADAAQRSGLSRSEWLRQVIERELLADRRHNDPHELYLRLMAKHPAPPPGAPKTNDAADHSRVLKAKLRAADRR